MPTYKAPVEDVKFLLNDVFHMERYGNMPGFADASPDVDRMPALAPHARTSADRPQTGAASSRRLDSNRCPWRV